MQITKPRARPITAYRGEKHEYTYWEVRGPDGTGYENTVNGVWLDLTVKRWYDEQLKRQTDPFFNDACASKS